MREERRADHVIVGMWKLKVESDEAARKKKLSCAADRQGLK
jgi:hypothetical protein